MKITVMLLINDIFFGKVQLPGIFEDLMNSAALKRLSGVHQSGAIFLVNPDVSHSRLEHSIGVMLLIRILGGSELEQIAGLLHDISHTAFSHVGDYVLEQDKEDYHEQIFEQILLSSDIPEILSWHGYRAELLLDSQFSILEQPMPGLCADRIDYTLRDSYHAGLTDRASVRAFISSLSLSNGLITVIDSEKADWINVLYKRLIEEVFHLPLHVYANRKLAELIRKGLKSEQLTMADLQRDDTYLLNKIRSTAEGYNAVRDIKQHKDLEVFIRKGMGLKMKNRYLNAMS